MQRNTFRFRIFSVYHKDFLKKSLDKVKERGYYNIMSKNLSIRFIIYSIVIILGFNVLPNKQIDYVEYSKKPLKKVSSLSEFKDSLEYKKYLESLKITMDIVKARTTKLEQFKKAKKLSDEDLALLLYLVGFEGNDLKEAWAIAKRESNGRPLAFNGNTKTGDNSWGIFQINMIGSLGPIRRDKYDLSSNKELLNPVTNAVIAFKMTRGGEDWSSWKGLTPRAQKWLPYFPKVNLTPYKIPVEA
jgi:hypothetical protein